MVHCHCSEAPLVCHFRKSCGARANFNYNRILQRHPMKTLCRSRPSLSVIVFHSRERLSAGFQEWGSVKHLLIFTSSHLHIFSSSHLLIFTSSHLHIFSSCLLALLPSCLLLLFYLSLEGGGRGSANETARNATLSHEMRFDRQKLK